MILLWNARGIDHVGNEMHCFVCDWLDWHHTEHHGLRRNSTECEVGKQSRTPHPCPHLFPPASHGHRYSLMLSSFSCAASTTGYSPFLQFDVEDMDTTIVRCLSLGSCAYACLHMGGCGEWGVAEGSFACITETTELVPLHMCDVIQYNVM